MLRASVCYGCFSLVSLAGMILCRVAAFSVLSMAFARMFPWLFLGGGGVFLVLSGWLPRAGGSAYYRIFHCLYHSGLLVLAAASFCDGLCSGSQRAPSDIRLAEIAGGALLCAGAIVLALIVWEQRKTDGARKMRHKNKNTSR